MAVSVGDIYFTAHITDQDNGGSGADSFSFVTTTALAPGEQITFHSPESGGDTTFTYQVGPLGLSALDRVTIVEEIAVVSSSTYSVENDPSGGSIVAQSGVWSVSDNDNVIASQGGQVIAAILNTDKNGAAWNDNIGVTSLSTTQMDAFILANPSLASPIAENVANGSTDADNVLFSGTNITLQGDDPAFWVGTDNIISHDTPTIGMTSYTSQDANITCFCTGALIATPTGEVAVETLQAGDRICAKAGDRICAKDGRDVAVKWIGYQSVSIRFGPADRLRPVQFAAGSLGDGLPHSDLTVTADHAMLVDGMLCNASALVNGATITRVPLEEMGDSYMVYHIETEAHEIILANGAATETYIDHASRRAFDNYAEYQAVFGDESELQELLLPRVTTARQLPAELRRRLFNALAGLCCIN